jgi:glycerol-3-phosphate O-acyltransferase
VTRDRLGNAFKRRRSVARDVLKTGRFGSELATLAAALGRPLPEVEAEAEIGLREIVAVQSPVFGLLFDHALGPMHTRAFTIDVDTDSLQQVKELNGKQGLVFLPTHRSYADAFILTQVLRENGLPRNHILGGDNVGFFPLGTIIRRSGGVLLRRSFKDDEVYKLVVREYLRHLVASGSNLEWYMEGGRSRTGKLRPPKYGLLRYLVDAIESDSASDLMLIPVSITYDQLHEIGTMAAEEAGTAKAREGIRWLANYARTQQKWIGKAYVRFGEPLSLRSAIARSDGVSNGKRWAVDKVAFEVFQRINRVTPVTAPALVTLALLGGRDRALTLGEVHGLVQPLLDYASQRGLPTTPVSQLREVRSVEEVLDALAGSKVVNRYDGGLEPVFKIEPGMHSVAAFYRNSAIHWFVNRAIVELGVMDASRAATPDSLERGWAAAFALRDLFKFEFFFSDKETFREEIKAEALLLDPAFPEHIAAPETRASILKHAPFLIAHRALAAFLEAYFIVADRLAALPSSSAVEQKSFLAQCVSVGRQYVLQGRLRNPECVSRELFGNALSLATNRGLVQAGGEDVALRRRRFADELTAAVAAVASIDEFDQRVRTGNPETS